MNRLFTVLLFLTVNAYAQDPGIIMSYYAPKDHALDADPDSEFWMNVPGVIIDKGRSGPVASLRSEFRSRWTDENLYFLFIAPYDTLNLKPDPVVKEETFRLWTWDILEIYIGANFDYINLYRELQLSPQGEFLDLNVDSQNMPEGWGDWHWNSGMTVKAQLLKDKKMWYGEMCVPITAIDRRPPRSGNEMRINVYYMQGPPRRTLVCFQVPSGPGGLHVPEAFGRMVLIK